MLLAVKQHMSTAKQGVEGAQPLFSAIWFVEFFFSFFFFSKKVWNFPLRINPSYSGSIQAYESCCCTWICSFHQTACTISSISMEGMHNLNFCFKISELEMSTTYNPAISISIWWSALRISEQEMFFFSGSSRISATMHGFKNSLHIWRCRVSHKSWSWRIR